MPNARIIRAVLFAHPEVSTLTIKERYLLIGLTSVANDWGKLWYHTGHIRSQVFPLDEISLNEIDVIMTVCSNAEKNCPIFSGFNGRKLHYSFANPADTMGIKIEILSVFRRIRDEIMTHLKSTLN